MKIANIKKEFDRLKERIRIKGGFYGYRGGRIRGIEKDLIVDENVRKTPKGANNGLLWGFLS